MQADEETTLRNRLGSLRESFDRSFSEAPAIRDGGLLSYLEIGIGSDSYAIRTDQIAGLFSDRSITKLPTTMPELLGIAGIRGSILPVYDLGALLGEPASSEEPRWLVVAAGAFVGLGFGRFVAQVRIPAGAIVPHPERGTSRPVRESILTNGRMVPVVSVAAVLESISHRVGADPQEQ